ncbi:MAG: hypothetical protein ACJATN_002589 [Neolewinella sp.]|jgi:hypothetical protein
MLFGQLGRQPFVEGGKATAVGVGGSNDGYFHVGEFVRWRVTELLRPN